MKKKLLKATVLTLCAVALVVGSVLATIAYLTASSGVSNVFTVGNVSITMHESKVNDNGQIPAGEVEKVITNSYHLVPDKTFHKDPTIQVTSLLEQDEMYLFVKSVNPIRSAEANNYDDRVPGTTPLTMREQMHNYGWVEYIRSGDGAEIIWVYGTRDKTTGVITPMAVNPTTKQPRGDGEGPAGEFKLCDEFTIHKDANVSLYDGVAVSFTAFAIQNSGLESVQVAWNAVKDSYPFQCGIVNPVNPYTTDTTYDPYTPVTNVEMPIEFPLMHATPTTTTPTTPADPTDPTGA